MLKFIRLSRYHYSLLPVVALFLFYNSLTTSELPQSDNCVASISPSATELNCNTNSIALTGSVDVPLDTDEIARWSNGAAGLSTTVNQAGTYVLEIYNTIDDMVICSASTVVTENFATPPISGVPSSVTLNCTTSSVAVNGTTLAGMDIAVSSSNGYSGNSLSFNIDQVGTYNITVTDPNTSCFSTAAIVVTENTTTPAITGFPASVSLNCLTSSVPVSGTSISGGVVSVTSDNGYSGSSLSFDITSAGSYTIEVTDPINGCSSSTSINATENTTVPTITGIPSNLELTCTTDNHSISGTTIPGANVSVSGPNGFSANSLSFSINTAGTYSISVTDPANGCSANSSINVTDNSTPPAITGIPASISLTCSNNQVSVSGSSISNGVVSVSGPNGFSANSLNFDVSSEGTYSVQVTDPVTGCFSSTAISVTDNQFIPSLNISPSSATLTCNNLTENFSILTAIINPNITVTGPNGFSANSLNFTASEAGTYSVSITDPITGCAASTSVTVSENKETPTLAGLPGSVDLNCEDNSVSISGSTIAGAGVSVSGPNGFSASGLSFNIDEAGTYNITVSHPVTGCETTASIVANNNESLIDLSAVPSSVELTCNNADIAVNGGTAPAGSTITVNGPNGFSTSSLDFSITSPGTYTIAATHPISKCIASTSIIATENNETAAISGLPGAVNLNCTNPTAAVLGTTLAGAGISVTGPNGFSASNLDFTVDTEGTYTVTVAHPVTGCESTAAINVTKNEETANIGGIPSSVELTCNNPSVPISGSTLNGAGISVTGPNGFNANSLNFNVSEEGTYNIVVTHPLSGCTSSTSVSVSGNNSTPFINGVPTSVQLNCDNLTAAISGTTIPNGIVSVTGPGGFNANSLNFNISSAGTYNISVQDPVTGCAVSQAIVVTKDESQATISGIPSTVALNCNNLTQQISGTTLNNAAVTVTTPSGNTINSLDFNVSEEGTYTISVKHPVSGCTTSTAIVVTQDESLATITGLPNAVELTCQSPIFSVLANTLSGALVNVTGPNNFTANSLNFTIEEGGNYNITVTHPISGCTTTASIAATENQDVPTISGIPSTINLTCDNPIGSIFGSTLTGAVVSVTGPNGFSENGLSFDVSEPGTYTINAAIPATGCSANTTFTVTDDREIPAINGIPSVVELTCINEIVALAGSTTFGALVSVTGPNNFFANSLNFSVSEAGTYSVNVEIPATGCTTSTTLVVTEDKAVPPINGLPTAVVLDCATSSVNAAFSTLANALVQVTAPNGNIISENTGFVINEAGTYAVEVTNTLNGCIATTTVNVTQEDQAPIIELGAVNGVIELTCNAPSQLINIATDIANPIINVIGPNNFSTNSSTFTVDTPGTYSVNVTNPVTNCNATEVIEIVENKIVPVLSQIPTTVVLTEENPTASIAGFSNVTDASVEVNGPNGFSAGSLFFTIRTPGFYTVQVINNATGCRSEKAVIHAQSRMSGDCSATQTLCAVLPQAVVDAINALPVGGVAMVCGPDSDSNTANGNDGPCVDSDICNFELMSSGIYTVTVATALGVDIVPPVDIEFVNLASIPLPLPGATVSCNAACDIKTIIDNATAGIANVSVEICGPAPDNGSDGTCAELTCDTDLSEPGVYTVFIRTSINGMTASCVSADINIGGLPADIPLPGAALSCNATDVINDAIALATLGIADTLVAISICGPNDPSNCNDVGSADLTQPGSYVVTICAKLPDGSTANDCCISATIDIQTLPVALPLPSIALSCEGIDEILGIVTSATAGIADSLINVEICGPDSDDNPANGNDGTCVPLTSGVDISQPGFYTVRVCANLPDPVPAACCIETTVEIQGLPAALPLPNIALACEGIDEILDIVTGLTGGIADSLIKVEICGPDSDDNPSNGNDGNCVPLTSGVDVSQPGFYTVRVCANTPDPIPTGCCVEATVEIQGLPTAIPLPNIALACEGIDEILDIVTGLTGGIADSLIKVEICGPDSDDNPANGNDGTCVPLTSGVDVSQPGFYTVRICANTPDPIPAGCCVEATVEIQGLPAAIPLPQVALACEGIDEILDIVTGLTGGIADSLIKVEICGPDSDDNPANGNDGTCVPLTSGVDISQPGFYTVRVCANTPDPIPAGCCIEATVEIQGLPTAIPLPQVALACEGIDEILDIVTGLTGGIADSLIKIEICGPDSDDDPSNGNDGTCVPLTSGVDISQPGFYTVRICADVPDPVALGCCVEATVEIQGLPTAIPLPQIALACEGIDEILDIVTGLTGGIADSLIKVEICGPDSDDDPSNGNDGTCVPLTSGVDISQPGFYTVRICADVPDPVALGCCVEATVEIQGLPVAIPLPQIALACEGIDEILDIVTGLTGGIADSLIKVEICGPDSDDDPSNGNDGTCVPLTSGVDISQPGFYTVRICADVPDPVAIGCCVEATVEIQGLPVAIPLPQIALACEGIDEILDIVTGLTGGIADSLIKVEICGPDSDDDPSNGNDGTCVPLTSGVDISQPGFYTVRICADLPDPVAVGCCVEATVEIQGLPALPLPQVALACEGIDEILDIVTGLTGGIADSLITIEICGPDSDDDPSNGNDGTCVPLTSGVDISQPGFYTVRVCADVPDPVAIGCCVEATIEIQGLPALPLPQVALACEGIDEILDIVTGLTGGIADSLITIEICGPDSDDNPNNGNDGTCVPLTSGVDISQPGFYTVRVCADVPDPVTIGCCVEATIEIQGLPALPLPGVALACEGIDEILDIVSNATLGIADSLITVEICGPDSDDDPSNGNDGTCQPLTSGVDLSSPGFYTVNICADLPNPIDVGCCVSATVEIQALPPLPLPSVALTCEGIDDILAIVSNATLGIADSLITIEICGPDSDDDLSNGNDGTCVPLTSGVDVSQPGIYTVNVCADVPDPVALGCCVSVSVRFETLDAISIPPVAVVCDGLPFDILADLSLPLGLDTLVKIQVCGPDPDDDPTNADVGPCQNVVTGGGLDVSQKGTYTIRVCADLPDPVAVGCCVDLKIEVADLDIGVPPLALSCEGAVVDILENVEIPEILRDIVDVFIEKPNGDIIELTDLTSLNFDVSEPGTYFLVIKTNAADIVECEVKLPIPVESLDIPFPDFLLSCDGAVIDLLDSLELPTILADQEFVDVRVITPSGEEVDIELEDVVNIDNLAFPTDESGTYEIIVNVNADGLAAGLVSCDISIFVDIVNLSLPIGGLALDCSDNPVINLLEDLAIPDLLDGLVDIEIEEPDGDIVQIGDNLTYTPNETGTHTLRVKINNDGIASGLINCDLEVDFDVELLEIGPLPPVSLSCDNPTVLLQIPLPEVLTNNALVSVTVIKPDGSSSREDTGNGNFDLTIDQTGEYCVRVDSDLLGCTLEACVTVNLIDGVDAMLVNTTNVSCFGFDDGTATITTNGTGTGAITLTLPDGTTTNDLVLTGLAPGDYTVTVSDAANCTDDVSFSITEPDPLVLGISNTNVSSPSASDGTATVTATGGTPNYTYNWSNGENTAMISGLPADTYTVTVTDANGCTDIISTTLGCDAVVTTSFTQPSCNGFTDGEACVTVDNATPPINFMWDDGTTSSCRSNIGVGSYMVTVSVGTGADLCEYVRTITVTEPTPLEPEVTTTDETAADNDGTATVIGEGGTPPYNIVFSDGQTFNNVLQATATNLSEGNYTVVVTDANGCPTSAIPFSIGGFPPDCPRLVANVTVDPLSCTEAKATVNIVTGRPPFTFNFSDGTPTGMDNMVTGLGMGAYSVTVTDDCNPPLIIAFNVNNLPDNVPPTAVGQDITITITPGSSGMITADQVDGGSSDDCGPVTLAIDEDTFDCDDLGANTVQLTVTDGSGNMATTTVTVTVIVDEGMPLLGCPADMTIRSCDTLVFYTPPILLTGSCPNAESDLKLVLLEGYPSGSRFPMGVTEVTYGATDGNGYVDICSFKVRVVSDTIDYELTTTDPTCHEADNGSAIIHIKDMGVRDNKNYEFLWNNPEDVTNMIGVSTTRMEDNLDEGVHNVNAINDIGCFWNEDFYINEPDPLTISGTAFTMEGVVDTFGVINLTVTGGTPPYRYTYQLDGSTISSEEDLYFITAGTYTVGVQDANNCSVSGSIEITAGMPTTEINIQNIVTDESTERTTNNANTAKAAFMSCPADIYQMDCRLPVEYDAPEVAVGYRLVLLEGYHSGSVFPIDTTEVTYGAYHEETGDVAICKFNVVIGRNNAGMEEYPYEIDITEPSCKGTPDGTARLNTTSFPGNFAVLWSNKDDFQSKSQEELNVTGLRSGLYNVNFITNNCCHINKDFYVEQPRKLDITFGTVVNQLPAENTGIINIMVTGGTAPYTYNWKRNGESINVTDEDLYYVPAGTYTVMVNDANGCSAAATIVLRNGFGIEPFATTDDTSTEIMLDGQVTAYPNPSLGLVNLKLDLPESSEVEIMVFDLLNRNVLNVPATQIQNESLQLDLSQFTNQQLFIKVRVNDEVVVKTITILE